MHLDELIDELLTEDRVCGIALPRLPNRDVLVDAGYLDGPRKRQCAQNLIYRYMILVVWVTPTTLDYCTKAVERIEEELKSMAQAESR